MSEHQKYTTGVCIREETYSLIWEICNFPHVQLTEELLSAQTIEFQFGKPSTVWSKWLGSLKTGPNGRLAVQLKLLEHHGKNSSLFMKSSWDYTKTGQPEFLKNRSEMGSPMPAQTNAHFVLEANHGWNMKLPPDVWKSSWSIESNGSLFIKINMEVLAMTPIINQEIQRTIQNFNTGSTNQLKESMAELSNDTTFADLNIVCSDGKELKAHQAILCARNPVFATTLKAEMSETSTGVIRVDDVSEGTMKILLHYLYTGELLPGWREPENILEWVYAAGKYQLENVLTLVDNLLGTDEVPIYTMQLLSLVNKLALKTAESRITEKLVQIASSIKSGDEFLKMFGNNQ